MHPADGECRRRGRSEGARRRRHNKGVGGGETERRGREEVSSGVARAGKGPHSNAVVRKRGADGPAPSDWQ